MKRTIYMFGKEDLLKTPSETWRKRKILESKRAKLVETKRDLALLFFALTSQVYLPDNLWKRGTHAYLKHYSRWPIYWSFAFLELFSFTDMSQDRKITWTLTIPWTVRQLVSKEWKLFGYEGENRESTFYFIDYNGWGLCIASFGL